MAKAYKGLPMEGVIATWYAKNTAADLARFTQTARMLSERLRPGGDVLEVAPGPGYLAIELAKAREPANGVEIVVEYRYVHVAPHGCSESRRASRPRPNEIVGKNPI